MFLNHFPVSFWVGTKVAPLFLLGLGPITEPLDQVQPMKQWLLQGVILFPSKKLFSMTNFLVILIKLFRVIIYSQYTLYFFTNKFIICGIPNSIGLYFRTVEFGGVVPFGVQEKHPG